MEDTKETNPSKTKELALTDEECFVLDVHNLLKDHPLFKDDGLPKPGVDYLLYALKRQPELRSLTHIEKREHLLNILIYGYVRDAIFIEVVRAKEEHGYGWMAEFPAKNLRILKDVIKEQGKMLPEIFKETSKGFSERDTSKKITKFLIAESVEFEKEPPKKTVDAKYKLVDNDDSA